jgi:hypothetical protein
MTPGSKKFWAKHGKYYENMGITEVWEVTTSDLDHTCDDVECLLVKRNRGVSEDTITRSGIAAVVSKTGKFKAVKAAAYSHAISISERNGYSAASKMQREAAGDPKEFR